MNTQQAIRKCNKKAWQEIKNIKRSTNMISIEMCISDAIEKTFGMWDRGVYMIGMKKLGAMGVLEGERVMRIRRANYDKHLSVIRNYLIEMIPERFFNTTMYKRLTGGDSLHKPLCISLPWLFEIPVGDGKPHKEILELLVKQMANNQYAPSVAGKHDLQLERELVHELTSVYYFGELTSLNIPQIDVQFEKKRGRILVLINRKINILERSEIVEAVTTVHPTFELKEIRYNHMHTSLTTLEFKERYQS